MADKRYLRRRGDRWYFHRRVPKDLLSRFRKEFITEALGTSDIVIGLARF